jgi:hypothetical protein
MRPKSDWNTRSPTLEENREKHNYLEPLKKDRESCATNRSAGSAVRRHGRGAVVTWHPSTSRSQKDSTACARIGPASPPKEAAAAEPALAARSRVVFAVSCEIADLFWSVLCLNSGFWPDFNQNHRWQSKSAYLIQIFLFIFPLSFCIVWILVLMVNFVCFVESLKLLLSYWGWISFS